MSNYAEVTLSSQEVDYYATLAASTRLTFANRNNRDRVAAKAKYNGHVVRKSSIRNQQMDPRYTVEGSHLPDRGLANDYRHWFSALYHIEPTNLAW